MRFQGYVEPTHRNSWGNTRDSQMTHLLECRSVGLDYPTDEGILRLYGEGISFSVQEGSFVSVVGGSGWGKSTLVNLLLGFERPTRGRIFANGEDITSLTFVKRYAKITTSVVFQRPTALPQLTVLQNLHLALGMSRIPRKEREQRIDEAMHFFGLENLAHSRPDSLSAGQRRRVDLARALAVRPQLMVLDEPTGDLDSSSANLVIPLLRGVNREHGTTVLMTTALPRHASTSKNQIHLRPPTIISRHGGILAGSQHV